MGQTVGMIGRSIDCWHLGYQQQQRRPLRKVKLEILSFRNEMCPVRMHLWMSACQTGASGIPLPSKERFASCANCRANSTRPDLKKCSMITWYKRVGGKSTACTALLRSGGISLSTAWWNQGNKSIVDVGVYRQCRKTGLTPPEAVS